MIKDAIGREVEAVDSGKSNIPFLLLIFLNVLKETIASCL